jgi:hypothetical protein
MLGGSMAVVAFGGSDTSGATRLAGVALVTGVAAVSAWFLAPSEVSAIGATGIAAAEPIA